MGIPVAQMAAVTRYLLKQRLTGRERYPLVLMLEPLFRCNLSCTGCGKIQYPVRNFRFNQSVLELLAPGNVEMIGAPERVSNSESQGRSASLTPALKVKQFHFTSLSEAV